jgi:hypothetical protein
MIDGVPAKGGSQAQRSPAGMMFVGSGYVGTMNGTRSNVILAFARGPVISRGGWRAGPASQVFVGRLQLPGTPVTSQR